MRILLAVPLAACTAGAPLSQIHPQIEIHADRDDFSLSMTTWVDLDALHDAIAAGAIAATLDGRGLVVDPTTTGYADQRDSYVATFALPVTESAVTHPATSQIAVTDGTITWSVAIADLFANDLAPVAPGSHTFVWPSAASPGPDSLIDWACAAIDGQASTCDLAVSQQFITADLDAAPGTHVTITAERSADQSSSGDGPPFFVRIDDRLDAQW